MSNNGMSPSIVGQLLHNLRVPPNISRGEIGLLKILVELDDADEGEQLTRYVPGGWMIDTGPVSSQICFRLIRHCFISMDGEESGGVSCWRVNDMGRMAAEGKSLADIEEAVR